MYRRTTLLAAGTGLVGALAGCLGSDECDEENVQFLIDRIEEGDDDIESMVEEIEVAEDRDLYYTLEVDDCEMTEMNVPIDYLHAEEEDEDDEDEDDVDDEDEDDVDDEDEDDVDEEDEEFETRTEDAVEIHYQHGGEEEIDVMIMANAFAKAVDEGLEYHVDNWGYTGGAPVWVFEIDREWAEAYNAGEIGWGEYVSRVEAMLGDAYIGN